MPTDPSQNAAMGALLDAALLEPPADRAAFVRQRAGADTALAEAVLELLLHPDSRPAGEVVQSSSTDELLGKLGTAPRLDQNRYHLQGEVDRGGMGAILRIHDQFLNRRVAMKVQLDRPAPGSDEERRLSHQVLGRFLEEAQVTSQLDHPGVVPVHELGLDHHGKVYFTMRLVKGRTASEIWQLARARQEDWTPTRALEVVLRICDTMAYAHDKGVLHRDLKPANVMVGRFGEVYVMDWGLAKVLGQQDRHDLRIRPEASSVSQLETARHRDADSDSGSSVVSCDGQQLGTPSYMAPEQARSEELDQRADVYSIGAMLYELLAGRAPFTTPGVREPAYRILREVADGPPKRIEAIEQNVPAELVAIVDKAMARDRERRYADVTALAKDLRAFVDQRAVSAYRTGALVELQLWIRRNKPLAASVAAAALTLVVGIAVTASLANKNAVLAQEKTELAAAESNAKESALREKARADGKVTEFNQLAGVVLYERAIANEKNLYPAWPHKIAAMEAWLQDDAGRLLAMQPEIEQTIAALRGRALPATANELESDRRSHPRFGEWENLSDKVGSLRRAQDVRSGRSPVAEPELPVELRGKSASELNAIAWPLVDWEKDDRPWGQEALALACARAAVAQAQGEDRATFGDTLAWALFWHGRDADAIAASQLARDAAPTAQREDFDGYVQKVEEHVAALGGEKGEAAVREAESQLAALTAAVSARRTWRFGTNAEDESARFLHDTLVDLLGKLGSLASKEKAGVEERLRWARGVEAWTLSHPSAKHTWAEARAAIAKADGVEASKLYAGKSIELRDQNVLGLVPIGMNPVTKLWEFYELRSAWDGKADPAAITIPTHAPDGSIQVTGATGIVFVLLPGGTVTLGSQSTDKDAPFYDAERMNEETLHEVTLSPFFVARHELTQGQWSRLWTWDEEFRDPGQYKAGQTAVGMKVTLSNPVEQVNWAMSDTVLTCHGMSLPTEAQWEYGCRGGTTTPWIVPFEELVQVANLADASAKPAAPGWPCESWRDGHVVHAPVGSFAANAFGLYDVLGNVWEWCRDSYGYYGSEREGDGLRSGSPTDHRGVRGGSYGDPALFARSPSRNRHAPSVRGTSVGARPSRALTP